jgi:hypothetical protein
VTAAHGVTELKQRPAPIKEKPRAPELDDQVSKFRMPRTATRDSPRPDHIHASVDFPSSPFTPSQPRVDTPGNIIEKPVPPESPTAR